MKVRYSYGVNLLSRADTAIVLPSSSDADEDIVTEPPHHRPKPKQRDLIDLSESPDPSEVGNSRSTHSRSTSHTNQTTIFAEPSSSNLQPLKHSAVFYTFPNTPNDSNSPSPDPIPGKSITTVNPTMNPKQAVYYGTTLPRPCTEGQSLFSRPQSSRFCGIRNTK
jgi:hypothetical protein